MQGSFNLKSPIKEAVKSGQNPSLFDYIDHVQVNLHFNAKSLLFIRPLAERLLQNDYAGKMAEFNAQRMRLRKPDLLSYEDWFKTRHAQALHKSLVKKYKDLTVEYYRDKERAYADYVARFSVHTSRMGRPVDTPPKPITLNNAMALALTYMCEHGTLPPLPKAETIAAPVDALEAARLRTRDGQIELLYPAQG